jgi:hypothetical protein
MLFTEDLVPLATSEDVFHLSIYSLHTISTNYNLEILTEETKIQVFQGKESIPSEIHIANRILGSVNKLTYLGYTLS